MRVVVLLALGACSYNPPNETGTDDATAPDDGPTVETDSPVDPDGTACSPFAYGDVCSMTAGDALTIASEQTIDTDDDPLCATLPQSGGTDACLIYRSQITITSTGAIRGEGSRPLILASRSTIVIDGKIDVSSRRTGTTGAAANHSACAHDRTPEADGGGGGGGAGGSFAADGGDGGTGDSDQSSGSAGNAVSGLSGTPAAMPAILRGGCSGQRGGNGGTGEDGGVPGSSGGALGVLAVDSISISSSITANGAGGDGGDTQAGGGGAGSGGMIVIESALIQFTNAIVLANGGGGGEGGNRHNGVDIDGNPGADGGGISGAPGGSGATPFGGPGGIGSFGANLGGNGSGSIVGGGGGGGSAGYIVLIGPTTGIGTVSPVATVP